MHSARAFVCMHSVTQHFARTQRSRAIKLASVCGLLLYPPKVLRAMTVDEFPEVRAAAALTGSATAVEEKPQQ
jgi:hypothetical protein